MNIYLLPYTWLRHFAVANYCASAALLAWWVVLTMVVVIGPYLGSISGIGLWDIGWDGAMLLGLLSGVVAGASQLAEGQLRRLPMLARLLRVFGAGMVALITSMFIFFFWTELLGPPIVGMLVNLLRTPIEAVQTQFNGKPLLENAQEVATNLADTSLVSLRYRLGVFGAIGFNTGLWTSVFRKGKELLAHCGAGLAAGLSGAVVWFAVGYTNFQLGTDNLYLAGAGGCLAFGWVFGFFSWGIPDDLYAGWLRVVTETRFGRRIPIDGRDGQPRERFVGHYPRGLDLYLPAEEGVMELHTSVMVDEQQQYRLRGLSIQPTRVERLLERVNMRYDASLPAPKEVVLQSEDRVLMGPPENQTIVEFLMLPREEQ